MTLQHYLQFSDFTADEYAWLFARAAEIKKKFKAYEKYHPLADRTLAMIFEKASTRTRVSFEAGMYQMGGSVLNLTTTDSQLGRAEPIEDTARVISRMVDIVMIRTFGQDRIEKFAEYSRVPVINGLTNEFHPCQILADIFTYIEHRGSIKGRTVAWVGDGNNMAHSWIEAAGVLGFELRLACPEGYDPNPAFLERFGKQTRITLTRSPAEAVAGAHVVNTDVWASMGQEEEQAVREKAFKGYRVDQALMKRANRKAIFLHCLPAHRGEEVAAEVIDGPQSRVWDEAENRLHIQKAIMAVLMGGEKL
jgi:ornithine carbamoyltransferase